MIKKFIRLGTTILAFALIAPVPDVCAHELPVSNMNIIKSDSKLHLELQLNAFELAFLSEMDTNKNNKIEKSEFDDHKEVIRRKILEALTIEINNDSMKAESSGLMLDMTSHHFVFRAHYLIPENISIHSLKIISGLQEITDRSHVTRVTSDLGGSKQRARLTAKNNTVIFNFYALSKLGTLAGIVVNKQNLLLLFSGFLVGIATLCLYKIKN